MPSERIRLDFASFSDVPQLHRYGLSMGRQTLSVGPGGERPLRSTFKGANILLLLLVRLARWRGVREDLRPEVIPVIEGLAKASAAALMSDAVAFGTCLHQIHKTHWLRDMLAFSTDGEEDAKEAKERFHRWFHLENATGRNKTGDMARIGIYKQALPPEAVRVFLDEVEISGVALDALERRLAGMKPLQGSWPPLLSATGVRLLGYLPSVAPSVREREADLLLLDRRYDEAACRMTVLVSAPGEGKSTLAIEWLRTRMGVGSLRQQLVYTWSFYQQSYRGETGQLLTAFWRGLAEALGVTLDDRMLDTEKAARLWEAMLLTPTLLWLDGMEVMLREQCRQPGGIHDAALAELVNLVVMHPEPHDCFILMASREHLRGHLRSAHPEVQHVLLSRVKAPVPVLGALPSQVGPSALELSLGAWSDQGEAPKDAATLRPLLRAKLGALAAENHRAILLAACLFDRPPEWEHVHALLTSTSPLPGLHVPEETMPDDAWSEAVDQLAMSGLLRVNAAGALEMHPLVAESLAEDFKLSSPKTWAAAHARLRDHFAAIPASDTPDTLEEMEPLFRAVWHGCQAGEYQKTYQTIGLPRISRGTSAYVMTDLNAHTAALTSMEQLCPDHVAFPTGCDMDDGGRLFVLVGIGYCLYDLDRFEEAYRPMRVAWSRITKAHGIDWVGPTSMTLLRLQYVFGDLDQSMPVMKRLLKGFMSAPISGKSFGVPPSFVAQALGWTGVVCCRTLWALGHRKRARFFLWVICGKTRSVIAQPKMILLPMASRPWHALLLLDMGDWQTCAQAEAAGELDHLDIRARSTGMDDWVRGRIRSEQARTLKAGKPRDALRQEAVNLIQAALKKVQGHYQWLEASMNLDLARHHQLFGHVEVAEKHRLACLTIAEERGFKLLRADAEMLMP
jgi:hypothetical protein